MNLIIVKEKIGKIIDENQSLDSYNITEHIQIDYSNDAYITVNKSASIDNIVIRVVLNGLTNIAFRYPKSAIPFDMDKLINR